MTLPTSGALTLQQIAANFVGESGAQGSYGTQAQMENLNYWKSVYYYNSSGVLSRFPTTNLSMSLFYGADGNCNCNCNCNCSNCD